MRRLGGFVIAVVLIAFGAGRAQQLPRRHFGRGPMRVTRAVSVKDGRQPFGIWAPRISNVLDNGACLARRLDVVVSRSHAHRS
jgi:hypothetical protein